jgi:hypothetical protein
MTFKVAVPDELVQYPPLIVYRSDIERLRRFGIANRYADSATAFRALLDRVGVERLPTDRDQEPAS